MGEPGDWQTVYYDPATATWVPSDGPFPEVTSSSYNGAPGFSPSEQTATDLTQTPRMVAGTQFVPDPYWSNSTGSSRTGGSGYPELPTGPNPLQELAISAQTLLNQPPSNANNHLESSIGSGHGSYPMSTHAEQSTENAASYDLDPYVRVLKPYVPPRFSCLTCAVVCVPGHRIQSGKQFDTHEKLTEEYFNAMKTLYDIGCPKGESSTDPSRWLMPYKSSGLDGASTLTWSFRKCGANDMQVGILIAFCHRLKHHYYSHSIRCNKCEENGGNSQLSSNPPLTVAAHNKIENDHGTLEKHYETVEEIVDQLEGQPKAVS